MLRGNFQEWKSENKTFMCINIICLIQVVKVADFGVARVQDQTSVMTAETGTYRWMAPEVSLRVTFST